MRPSDGTGHLTTEELFRQHSAFVSRFLARLGVPQGQLEDALQEVFLVVHRNGGYRPGIAKPTSYLANIAVRAAAQHRRRQGAARARHSEAPVERIAGGREDPAHVFQVQQDLERLQLALERLPDDLRTTLLLADMEGESCVSIAAGLGCPVGTVYWRLHKARKQLHSALAVVDGSARSARQQARSSEPQQPTHARLEERAVRMGSLVMIPVLFEFKQTEAARLLRLAREEAPATPPVEEMLARHQHLVHSGAELPTWSSTCVTHAGSWASVLGLGPLAAGTAAIGAVAALVVLAPGSEPPQTERTQPSAGEPVAVAAAQRVETAVAEHPQAAQAETAEMTPTHTARLTRDADGIGSDVPPAAAESAPQAPGRRATTTAVVSAARTAAVRAGSVRARATAGGSNRASAGQSASAAPAPGVRSPTESAAVEPSAESPSPREESQQSVQPKQQARAEETAAPEEPQEAEEPTQPRSEEAQEEAQAAAQPQPSEPPPDPETLAEIREVARAERLLATDPGRVLAMTRQMRTRFEDGYFREERAYLEVMALHGLGRTNEMRQSARAFLRAYPRGPYATRVRRTLEGVDATP